MASPAEKLLQRFGVEHPTHIDLEAIAFELGALVVYQDLDGCEARIVGNGKKAIITVNSKSSSERQRFSLGHELGHWTEGWAGRGFLCGRDDIRESSSLADTKRDFEAQANRFAADLLLPDYLFVPACIGKALTIDAAQLLAEIFRSSITATVIKLVKRSTFPGIAVCYSRGKREWFVTGPKLPENCRPLYELHYDTDAFELLYGQDWGKTAASAADASRWIDRRDAGQFRLKAQSIKVSKERVLSLLWFQNLK